MPIYPNVILPADRNVFADPHDVGQLEEPLRSRIYTTIRDAPFGGLVLVSGRRSPWQQYLLRVGRVGASRAFNPAYPGYPRTALPYRSQHQKGLAADMGGRDLSWLVRNARSYGLARTVSSEIWHFEAVGTPTRRILHYPGTTTPPPPPRDEGFGTMNDAQIDARFQAVNDKLDKLIGGAMKQAARIEELEKDRFRPTTVRVRQLHDAAGLPDE